MEDNDSEEERVGQCRQKKATTMQLKKLQQVVLVTIITVQNDPFYVMPPF